MPRRKLTEPSESQTCPGMSRRMFFDPEESASEANHDAPEGKWQRILATGEGRCESGRVIQERAAFDRYAESVTSDPEWISASMAERLRDAYGTGWMSQSGQSIETWSITPEEQAALLEHWTSMQAASLTPEFTSAPEAHQLHSVFVVGWTMAFKYEMTRP